MISLRPDGVGKLQLFDKVFRKIVAKEGLSPEALEGNAFLNTVLVREMDENGDGLVNQVRAVVHTKLSRDIHTCASHFFFA